MSCVAQQWTIRDLELNGLGKNPTSGTGFLTSDKLLNLFKPQFPHLLNGIIKVTTP